MRRMMTFETLDDYLTSAYATVMLCQANADAFAIGHSDALDVDYKISLFISELEDLRQKMKMLSKHRTLPSIEI